MNKINIINNNNTFNAAEATEKFKEVKNDLDNVVNVLTKPYKLKGTFEYVCDSYSDYNLVDQYSFKFSANNNIDTNIEIVFDLDINNFVPYSCETLEEDDIITEAILNKYNKSNTTEIKNIINTYKPEESKIYGYMELEGNVCKKLFNDTLKNLINN